MGNCRLGLAAHTVGRRGLVTTEAFNIKSGIIAGWQNRNGLLQAAESPKRRTFRALNKKHPLKQR
jgi:hypothetical protein